MPQIIVMPPMIPPTCSTVPQYISSHAHSTHEIRQRGPGIVSSDTSVVSWWAMACRASSICTNTLSTQPSTRNHSSANPADGTELGNDDQLARPDDGGADDESGPELREPAGKRGGRGNRHLSVLIPFEHDAVGERADLLDLDRHFVARLEPPRRRAGHADAVRRAGQDHRAGQQRGAAAEELDEFAARRRSCRRCSSPASPRRSGASGSAGRSGWGSRRA